MQRIGGTDLDAILCLEFVPSFFAQMVVKWAFVLARYSRGGDFCSVWPLVSRQRRSLKSVLAVSERLGC